MNNQIKRPDSKNGPGKRTAHAKHDFATGTAHPLTVSRARSLAVQRLNSFGKSRKGGAYERARYTERLEDLSGRTPD